MRKHIPYILLIWILSLSLLFSGCSILHGGDTGMNGPKRDFPEDIAITALCFHRFSTAMEPYYIMRPEEDGIHWYVSRDEEDPASGYMASNVITDASPAEAFSKALIDAGVLKWDGYSRSKPLPRGLLDGDNGFSLKLTLSDGSTLEARGSNIYPSNYSEIQALIYDTFEAHEDYSKYYPTSLPEEELKRIEIKIGSPYTSQYTPLYSVSLIESYKQWAVVLRDPRGEYLEAETIISAYAETEDPLPFDEYAGLLQKYDILAMNGTHDNWENQTNATFLQVFGFFEGDKMVEIHRTIDLDEYDGFIREFIGMTKTYYESVK